MFTQIGIVAGEILELLEERNEPVAISEIQTTIDEEWEMINMAIGWLILERYVHVEERDERYLFPAKDKKFPSEVYPCRDQEVVI